MVGTTGSGENKAIIGGGRYAAFDTARKRRIAEVTFTVEKKIRRPETVPVDLFTMLLGGKLSVAGLDRAVMLDIPPETHNKRVFRLTGLGMPKMKQPDQRGDFYVTAESVLPQHLTARQKELVEQWRGMR